MAFNLDAYINWREVDDALAAITYDGSRANLEDALLYITHDDFKTNAGHRGHVNTLLILITNDGDISTQEEEDAERIKSDDDITISVAYLSGADTSGLRDIGSASNKVRPASEYRSDQDLQESVLSDVGCGFGVPQIDGLC